MKVKAVAFCALVMAASPAAAQPWGPYRAGSYAPAVTLYEIHAALRANGLRPVTQPVRSGPYIVVRAVDSFGDTVRVMLNARWGNIVAVAPLPPAPVLGGRVYRGEDPYRPYEPSARYGAVRPDPGAEPVPGLGPNGFNGRPGALERRPASDPSGRLPMPRPRPAMAAAAAVKPPPETVGAPGAAPAAPPPPVTTGTLPASESFPPAAPLE